ncbi:MBL fold metallo-hydrolase [Noviherbaspirillum sp. Root189]|uniref:MBL fold metallo-hydrolase n=1 Tax=Noviherbaspirillum sp. Root189 TaxID=1736487 RepID=UPI00070E5454|nr:MBL fold metallo-hydrolase [Noviherbaspirillum sp. Root189]KRB72961.1 MBL fold metallo-hydrolase [Noviherbaspirillum sp. Root189]
MSSTTFASASDVTEQKAKVVELAKGAYGYISDSDPNCGFVVGDDAVLIIDTRATPALARDLIDDIRTVTDKPVKYIFLTHYHAVRVLGASAFNVDAVFSSTGTHQLILERGAADYESEVRRFPRLFKGVDEIPGLTMPHVTFDDSMSFWLGGRELRFMHLGRGHSAGDSVCWLPDCGVLYAGDLVENNCAVYTGDAYMRDWTQTLERVRALRADVMVPGRGAVLTSRQQVSDAIDSTKDFIVTLLGAVEHGLRQGQDLKGCYRIAEQVMTPRFGDWPVYKHALAFDVARAYDELRGLEHPQIWTAARDQDLWARLHN